MVDRANLKKNVVDIVYSPGAGFAKAGYPPDSDIFNCSKIARCYYY